MRKLLYLHTIYFEGTILSFKQALKFSEDQRSGVLTHTHTHTERESERERERDRLTSRP